MAVVLITADLMVSSAAGVAARQRGIELVTRAAAAAIDDLPAIEQAFIDLESPGLDLPALIAKVRAVAPKARIIAFGPHVQTPKLAAAQAAGCDVVLTRGQFHVQLGNLLAKG